VGNGKRGRKRKSSAPDIDAPEPKAKVARITNGSANNTRVAINVVNVAGQVTLRTWASTPSARAIQSMQTDQRRARHVEGPSSNVPLNGCATSQSNAFRKASNAN
jgi:hypothetical protein